MTTDKLRVIERFSSAPEAQVAKNYLYAHGVESFLDGSEAVTLLSHVGTALGGVKLSVLESDAERAIELLQKYSEENSSKSDWFCVECRESIDAAFDECWKCGRSREESEQFEPSTNIQTTAESASEDPQPAATAIMRPDVNEVVNRAWNSSVIALAILPVVLNVYSCFLLLKALTYSTGTMTETAKRQFLGASLINAAVLLIVGIVLRTTVQ